MTFKKKTAWFSTAKWQNTHLFFGPHAESDGFCCIRDPRHSWTSNLGRYVDGFPTVFGKSWPTGLAKRCNAVIFSRIFVKGSDSKWTKTKCVHIMIYLKVYLNAWCGMHPHKKTTAPPNKKGEPPRLIIKWKKKTLKFIPNTALVN